mgnify:FL=1
MAHLDEIRGLAEYHATRISSSPRDWMNYLDTAARLYRYPFMDQLLIHAQRPKQLPVLLWNYGMKNAAVGKSRSKGNCSFR